VAAGASAAAAAPVWVVPEEAPRDRPRRAPRGVLIVVATIAAGVAEVVVDREVIARGFDTPDDDGEELLEAARDAVDDVLERCLANRMTEVNLLQQELHDALAPLVHRMTGKRPMVVPVVIEV